MANRLALRDLQARLSERLQRARAQPTASGWLAVELAGRGYLLPLSQSGEIFPWAAPMRVPYTASWFTGVVNLRGGVYGVVDMRQFLFPGESTPRTDMARTQSRLIAFNAALDLNCVIMVDRLAGLRNPQSFVHERELSDQESPFLGAQLVDEEGRVWQEIDLQRLAAHEQFLSVNTAQSVVQ